VAYTEFLEQLHKASTTRPDCRKKVGKRGDFHGHFLHSAREVPGGGAEVIGRGPGTAAKPTGTSRTL
jgi:hypothetical protein